ncbi:MAG: hypothetical protein M3P82_02720 [Bacteroidota bacterium]|nr:hypothetical protein [Bacteroidota bacterium]
MITIDKPGKSKQELLKSLEKIKSGFASQIQQYDLKVETITDGYSLKAKKKILFIDATADIRIKAEEGKFVVEYETKNVPQSKINEAIEKVKQVLEKS